MQYPEHLLKLIAVFKKLPGVGAKSAERFAFHLLEWPQEKLAEMAHIVEQTKNQLTTCSVCGSLTNVQKCLFCTSPERNREILCVTASPKDIFSIEQTHEYKGHYHVLGGLFSPLQDEIITFKALEKLKNRIQVMGVLEVILALDSTLEGDATALLIKKELRSSTVKISRLALGLPMGSSLDYIDGGTLARALAGRHTY